MLIELKGLVIRTVMLTESDKLLTLLTAEQGKITVCGKGVRSIKSRSMSAAELYCYGSYVLYKKGEYYWIRESELIESFYALRTDVLKMALAAYVCEVVGDSAMENMPEEELLQLSLNTLYMISKGTKPLPAVKGAFELRLAAQLGFMPNLNSCASCGISSADIMYLEVMNGRIICSQCRKKKAEANYISADAAAGENNEICSITPGALCAMRYAISCPAQRLFAFALDESELAAFSDTCERYLVNQLERGFKTLDFYKSMLY